MKDKFDKLAEEVLAEKIRQILMKHCHVSPNGVADVDTKQTWENTRRVIEQSMPGMDERGALQDIVILIDGVEDESL